MKLTHIITVFLSAFVCIHGLYAQGNASMGQSDILTYEKMMEDMSGAVEAPAYLDNAMKGYINRNSSRKNTCYRIRIFFNNSQNSRTASSEIAREFSERYPDVPVYNQYVNPYFKVTVGDFRTKSEAMMFMTAIKPHYSSAFLVKEAFVIPSAKNQ